MIQAGLLKEGLCSVQDESAGYFRLIFYLERVGWLVFYCLDSRWLDSYFCNFLKKWPLPISFWDKCLCMYFRYLPRKILGFLLQLHYFVSIWSFFFGLCILLFPQVLKRNLGAGLVVSVVDPQPGEQIIDCCAAPGGKSLYMASRLCGQGNVYWCFKGIFSIFTSHDLWIIWSLISFIA